MSEMIVAAAIRVEVPEQWRGQKWDGRRTYPDFLTISAPPPARHHTLMHPSFDMLGRGIGPDDQGFITSTGRYVDRQEGLRLVREASQPMRTDGPFLSHGGTELYSEDLW